MENTRTDLLNEVSTYYSEKLALHGDTPRGVDWNSEESQVLRFKELCKIIDSNSTGFSLNDLGCGYGALFDFLKGRYVVSSYFGVDISEDMIRAAKLRHPNCSRARFINGAVPNTQADYGVASGIFNVRLKRTDAEWYEYLTATLDVLDGCSRLGFAFNCLTSYSDVDKKRDDLYYADPCRLFDLCKRKFSRQVALLHDYGLYEFTILVRKAS